MKKLGALILFTFLFLNLVVAQGEKIEVSTIKEAYSPGEELSLKVSLYDSSNNPLSGEVSLILESADKSKKLEQKLESNKIIDINLGEQASAGYWTATATFNGIESKSIFSIESSELASFNLEGDQLIVTNIGNLPYTKDVQIIIGDTISVKKTGLDMGEQVSFRLVAPDGNYNIRITDGKTSLTKSDVALTGNAIGILDERIKANNPITGGNSGSPFSKNNMFAYLFILVLVGSAILLAVERNYTRLSKK